MFAPVVPSFNIKRLGLIAIEGMKFYAYHGYYPEERKIGGWYTVDVYVETNVDKTAQDDNLEGTINYETIFRIVRMEMQTESQLIESVAHRILNRMKGLFGTMELARVRISKLHPPVGEEVARAFVELSESYRAECSKCKKPMLIHAKDDCWSKHGLVYPETRASYVRSFGPNVCPNCIKPLLVCPREVEE